MPREQFEGDYGGPTRRPGERLEHETRLADPRPRERRRNRRAGELLGLGVVSGAGLFALGVWLFGALAGHHYSALVYIVAAVIGAAVLAGILPYFALERFDGADAAIVRQRASGRADAPVAGAEAADQDPTRQRPT